MPYKDREKRREYDHRYYEDHKEEVRQRRLEWYAANKERLKEKYRQSRRLL